MKIYGNRQGNSGVTAYETGADFIRVRFTDSRIYTYTCNTAGKEHIDQMKILAAAGRGLSTYISRYVKEKFEH